jgi:hypothetical protein
MNENIKGSIWSSMTETSDLDFLMRLLKPLDFQFLYLIRQHGGVSNWWINEAPNREYKDSVRRCKHRNLISVAHRKTAVWYELTPLGFEVLEEHLHPGAPKPVTALAVRSSDRQP